MSSLLTRVSPYLRLLTPVPGVDGRPEVGRIWEFAALMGSWLIAGSVMFRTPFSEPYDLFPSLVGSMIDTAIVTAREHFGFFGEVYARSSLAICTNFGVYAFLRSPLWVTGLSVLGLRLYRALPL